MERHATNPSDENDRSQTVIRRQEREITDQREQIQSLKAQIFKAAARDILGRGAIKPKALAGDQHVDRESQIDELVQLFEQSDTALASSQRLLKVNEEALTRASAECVELEAQLRSAVETIEAMTSVARIALSSMHEVKGKKTLSVQQRLEVAETALKDRHAKDPGFPNADGSIPQPKGKRPQEYSDLSIKPTQDYTAPPQTMPESRVQQQTEHSSKAAFVSDRKLVLESRAMTTPLARQHAASQPPIRLPRKPVSENKMTSTLSEPAHDQMVRPFASAWSEIAKEAERFPALGVGRKPELPSTRPDKVTVPYIGSSKPTFRDLDTIRADVRRQAAEGTLRPLTKKEEEKFARRQASRVKRPPPRYFHSGKSEPQDVPEEDVVKEEDTMSDQESDEYYSLSDDEASSSHKAAVESATVAEPEKAPTTEDTAEKVPSTSDQTEQETVKEEELEVEDTAAQEAEEEGNEAEAEWHKKEKRRRKKERSKARTKQRKEEGYSRFISQWRERDEMHRARTPT